MTRPLASVLESTFSNLDQRIKERWNAGNLSHGFWRSGVIPKLISVDALREYGFWQAEADLFGMAATGGRVAPCKGLSGQLSVALIGGHTRMGIFLPNRLLEGGVSAYGESLTDAVARAHDGLPAPIIRRVGADTLFDRIFTEAPFSADWLLRCTRDENAQAVLETHLAWRVIDLWESALRAVMSRQSHDLGIVIRSSSPLPAIVTEALPLTLQDAYEIQPGYWITIVTLAGCEPHAAEDPDLSELEARLQTLLPDHGITVQKDATE